MSKPIKADSTSDVIKILIKQSQERSSKDKMEVRNLYKKTDEEKQP